MKCNYNFNIYIRQNTKLAHWPKFKYDAVRPNESFNKQNFDAKKIKHKGMNHTQKRAKQEKSAKANGIKQSGQLEKQTKHMEKSGRILLANVRKRLINKIKGVCKKGVASIIGLQTENNKVQQYN